MSAEGKPDAERDARLVAAAPQILEMLLRYQRLASAHLQGETVKRSAWRDIFERSLRVLKKINAP